MWFCGLVGYMESAVYLAAWWVLSVCGFNKMCPKLMAESNGLGVGESSGELLIKFNTVSGTISGIGQENNTSNW